jgi:hypothetical protein
MCFVSLVLSGGMELPDNDWTPTGLEKFQKIVEEAKEFDKQTGQPDCEVDEKLEWLKDLEARMRKLEAKQALQEQQEK